MSQRISAWSFSRLQTYEQCPAKAKYQFIDRIPVPFSEAMTNGKLFHEAAELFLKGAVKQCPETHKAFKPQLMKLRKQKAQSELEWCFNREWRLVDWLAKDAWLRIKVDAASKVGNELQLIDFKTGKIRDEHLDQLGLYALGGFVAEPDVTCVKAELWYFDHIKTTSTTFVRADVRDLKKSWTERVQPMLEDEEFAPKPNQFCRWCQFSKRNGGACQF